jgi:hypothetical protein
LGATKRVARVERACLFCRNLRRCVGPTQVARFTLVTSVDVIGEDWPHCDACGGGADRRAPEFASTPLGAGFDLGVLFLVCCLHALRAREVMLLFIVAPVPRRG